MKKIVFLSLLLSFALSTYAQKHDYIWDFGYNYGDTIRRMRLDFSTDSLFFEYSIGDIDYVKTSAVICDSLGQYILGTSGCEIKNQEGMVLLNGDGLNPGILSSLFCDIGHLGELQYGFFLPQSNNQAFLIHGNVDLYTEGVLYSKIDIEAANGQGEILEKNQTITNTRIRSGGFAAVKHGNGKDWWLAIKSMKEAEIIMALLDERGFTRTDTFYLGAPMLGNVTSEEFEFSPDGTKLALYNSIDNLQIYDFDRATGTLSNAQHFPIIDTADIAAFGTGGMAWSVDSRFIYTSNRAQIYQYDTWATDIGGSLKIVAEKDDFIPPIWFAPDFGLMERMPNGQILCKPVSGSADYLHIIANPEREGVACNVKQHILEPPYPIANIPIFPNYRLGPIDNSSCDTLGLDNHPLAGYRYDRLGGLAVDFTEVSWYEPDTWSWDFGDPNSGAANTSNERYPTHIFSQSGYFTVCLTVSNQYGSDMVCKDVWLGTTGISDVFIEKNADYLLFPNPTENLVHWRTTQENSQNKAVKQVLIYDATGRLVRRAAASGQSVELLGLPSGLYRLVALDGDNGVLFSGNVSKQ